MCLSVQAKSDNYKNMDLTAPRPRMFVDTEENKVSQKNVRSKS
jgi:hypothetical protein